MNEKVADALNEVRDAHIEEAAKTKKSRKKMVLRIAAAAAMLALVIGVALAPPTITAKAVSLPGERRSTGSYDQAKNDTQTLLDFYTAGSVEFISGRENAVWSPANAFIGLAMLAELTEGQSRGQIISALGMDNLEQLRQSASNLWENVYKDDGHEICTLANSLWLDNSLTYDQDITDALAYYYYASIYKGNVDSKKMNNAIGAWLDQNTGGLLTKRTENIQLPEGTLAVLYSTLYLQGTWQNEFSKSNNTEDVFHSPDGDVTVTYMNKKQGAMNYYWADNFSAVRMDLKNGADMWFILPDEGYTTADILPDGQYLQMVSGQWENGGAYKVNLSLPKFDISYGKNLADGLKQMGITDVFDSEKADFSALTGDTALCLSAVNQNVRIVIDEEGVKAATYIEFPMTGSAAPPEEIVDFIVDRPFLFVVSKSCTPLFVGCVTNP